MAEFLDPGHQVRQSNGPAYINRTSVPVSGPHIRIVCSTLKPLLLGGDRIHYVREHGLRVIVHTANLIHCECNYKSQVLFNVLC